MGSFFVLNNKRWLFATQQNMCSVVRFFLKYVVFGDDHVVLECLQINDTFFKTEWVVGVEVKWCHRVRGSFCKVLSRVF